MISNTVSIFRNTSTGGSITSGSFAAKVDFTTGTMTCGLAVGDLDDDGKLDLATSNLNSNTGSVFRNTTSPPTPTDTPTPTPTNTPSDWFALGSGLGNVASSI